MGLYVKWDELDLRITVDTAMWMCGFRTRKIFAEDI